METITFYSYKGGVGRTLALANISLYLSRFGQNVCIIDFDLEAPGLHYKFPQILQKEDIKQGLVDYIYEFAIEGHIPESIKKYSHNIIPGSESSGELQLIPAGNVLSSDYWRKLALIDWHNLFYKKDSEGIPFFIGLKEMIEDEFNPDFLLIDSRTGITEMSGLCTSLLPDKVVFLITNNQENIDGAHQILQSIQQVERLPEQKPAEINFVLTRIPYPDNEECEEDEKELLNQIKDRLNSPIGITHYDKQHIHDICILHSDRDLELSESLRVNQLGLSRESPLLRSYLKLFSKVIPNEVIEPKIENILDRITTTENLLEDPDKTQEELEGLVANYPHPKSLERLIKLYLLRKEPRNKVLATFHDLWGTFEINNEDMIREYTYLFMKYGLGRSWEEPFELEIIERYLKTNPENKISIEWKLASAYAAYKKPDIALEHYFKILNQIKDKNKVLLPVFDLMLQYGLFNESNMLFNDYSDIIDEDTSLRVKKIEILFKLNKLEDVENLLNDGGITEKNLLYKNPNMYFRVMETLGKSEEAEGKLESLIESAKNEEDLERLYQIGTLFYEINRSDVFEKKIYGMPKAEELFKALKQKYTRNSYVNDTYL